MPKRQRQFTQQTGPSASNESLNGITADFKVSDLKVDVSKFEPDKKVLIFNFISTEEINGGGFGRIRFFTTSSYIPPLDFEPKSWVGSKLQRLLEFSGREQEVREILGDFDIHEEEDAQRLFNMLSDAVLSITVALNPKGYPTVKRINVRTQAPSRGAF